MPPNPRPTPTRAPRQLLGLTSHPANPQRPTPATAPANRIRSFRPTTRSRLPPLGPYPRLLFFQSPFPEPVCFHTRFPQSQPCRVIIPLYRRIATAAARPSAPAAAAAPRQGQGQGQEQEREQEQEQEQAAQLSVERYHTLADTYIDNLVMRLEELQEEREDVDVEYSVPSTFPPIPPPPPPYRFPLSPPPPPNETRSPTNAPPAKKGRRPNPLLPALGHLRPEQAAAEPADLAEFAGQRAEEV